ncbi:uncharacterized protein LOC129593479 [Paramacrobiotus metropolitanus]|uniref:uncharacterized protein LOC129593479 n=1 Tax=Paramacrobiotus metropolitanus TaxID=2943436 RepID=UPI002445F927|nr:uncharacterized protein LOC129593479 [Paramacrobiotus metropolitanus]
MAVLAEVRELFSQLLAELLAYHRVNGNDRVRLVFEHPELANRAFSTPVMPHLKMMQCRIFWTTMRKVTQSTKSFAMMQKKTLATTRTMIVKIPDPRFPDQMENSNGLEKEGHIVEKIQDGSSITMLKIPGLKCKFIDTLSFMPRSLSELPKDLGIDHLVLKGFFPYAFNTPANQNYHGPLPGKEYFDCSRMSGKKFEEIEKWYDEAVNTFGNNYNLLEECKKYCVNDVLVLRECCRITRKNFMDMFPGIDPFDSVTNPSAVLLAFQVHYLKPNTIGIIPPGGYGGRQNQSFKGFQWLSHIERQLQEKQPEDFLQTARSAAGEKLLDDKICVDGFWEPTGTCYQFYGCFWHGCKKCFPDQRRMNTVRMRTFGELREETLRIKRKIESYGRFFVGIWECEYDELVKSGKIIPQKEFRPPLNVRDHLFGGRTEIFAMYKEIPPPLKGKAFDFISLYPSIMVYGKYPVGHPTILYNNFGDPFDLSEYYGVIYCRVLPPKNLFVPTLPMRLKDGRTVYTLCRSCSEEVNIAKQCEHTDEERELEGAWITPLMEQAVSDGYKISNIFEIHHFEETSQFNPETKDGGIFAQFILDLIRDKIVNSGFPAHIVTEEEKWDYCRNYAEKLGIVFEPDEVQLNPGAKYCTKIWVNAVWGRFVMKALYQQHKYCNTYKQMKDIVFNTSFETKDVRIVNNGKALDVTYMEKKNWAAPNKRCNPYIGVFTTGLAQLKLLQQLRLVEDRLLYCDTDSVMFVSELEKPDPPLGDLLGEFSDDLGGNYFVEWLALAKKTYCQMMSTGEERIKCKGIPKTEALKDRFHGSVLRDMLFSTGPSTVQACDDITFKRNTTDFIIQTVPLQRRVGCTFTSRVIGENFVTYPHGYENIPFPKIGSKEMDLVFNLLEKYTPAMLYENIDDDVALESLVD